MATERTFMAAMEGTRAYFGEGRCSGHAQFNGRYCRDEAGPERWCIHCAGFMLVAELAQWRQQYFLLKSAREEQMAQTYQERLIHERDAAVADANTKRMYAEDLEKEIARLTEEQCAKVQALRDTARINELEALGQVQGLEAEVARLTGELAESRRTVKTCSNCGHPQSWHRHDDADSHDPSDPNCPFRCLGYDCDGPGFPAGTPESRCGCKNFITPEPPREKA